MGTDGIGRGLREDLGGGGVDCTSPLFVAGPSGSTTSVTTVVVAEEGRTRACLHTPGTCGELGTGDVERALIGREEGFPEEGFPEEGPEEALDDLFRDAAVFHTDTRHTGAALYLAREAVRRGILVSVDVEKDRGEAMERIVALASLVFGNVDRLREYKFEENLTLVTFGSSAELPLCRSVTHIGLSVCVALVDRLPARCATRRNARCSSQMKSLAWICSKR